MENSAQKLESHPCITTCPEIDEICKPIKKLGITYFSLARVFRDGSRISFCNHLEWQLYFYQRFVSGGYQKHHVVFEKLVKHTDLPVVWSNYPKNEALVDAATIYGIPNGVALSDKHEDYTDVIHFSAEGENANIILFCLSNVDLLWRFVNYFREKVRPLFTKLENNRIIPPKIYGQREEAIDLALHELDAKVREEFINETQSNRIYIPNQPKDVYLTKSEWLCLKFVSQGKTSAEIAELTYTSPRTVEGHLARIKEKMGCTRLTEVIRRATRDNIIVD